MNIYLPSEGKPGRSIKIELRGNQQLRKNSQINGFLIKLTLAGSTQSGILGFH